MIGLLIHGDLPHLGNNVRPNDAPLQPFFEFDLNLHILSLSIVDKAKTL